jgi:hypothetical protein
MRWSISASGNSESGLRNWHDFAGAVMFEDKEVVVKFLERGAVTDANEGDAGGA